jgi:protein SCO1/2
MKSSIKIGILVITLVVPVLVYFFLRTFGENHYSLPTYFPEDISEQKVNDKVIYDTVFHQIPDFKIVDQNNRTLTGASFKDKVLVVDFFFTRCPGICPQMSSQLSRVQESFISQKDVQILSFTVDPEFDQPGILKEYAKKFEAKDDKWFLATTNSKTDVFNIGFYGFKVPSDTVDKFLHSEKVLLVDKDKHIRGFYNGTNKKEVDRLITEIDILLYEYGHNRK